MKLYRLVKGQTANKCNKVLLTRKNTSQNLLFESPASAIKEKEKQEGYEALNGSPR